MSTQSLQFETMFLKWCYSLGVEAYFFIIIILILLISFYFYSCYYLLLKNKD